MQDFLNPKSMLTPGAAGGIVMLVANTLWVKFGIMQELTGLAVSAVLSLLIVARYAAPLWERGCYFALNGLIIFCVAGGVTGAAGKVTGAASGPRITQHRTMEMPRLAGLIGTAEAATEEEIRALCGTEGQELDENTRKLCAVIREQRDQLTKPPVEPPKPSNGAEQEKRRFFQPWFQERR